MVGLLGRIYKISLFNISCSLISLRVEKCCSIFWSPYLLYLKFKYQQYRKAIKILLLNWNKLIITQNFSQSQSILLPLSRINQKLKKIFNVRWVILQISPINPNWSLNWKTRLTHKLQIKFPNFVMLSNWQSTKCSIKSSTSATFVNKLVQKLVWSILIK